MPGPIRNHLPAPGSAPARPATPSSRPGEFQRHLSRGLNTAAKLLSAAGPLIPGAGLVSVGLGGLSELLGDRSPAAPSPGGQDDLAAAEGLIESSRGMNVRYLALQAKMEREGRLFSTLSNLMKARHETARAAINNLR